ncbi:MAG: 3-oxoacyl-ACP synthase III family protein [Bacteroidota bacterium]
MADIYSIITGTGSYIPEIRIKNEDFLDKEFYNRDGTKFTKTNEEIVAKLEEITTIKERRYASDDISTSDIAYFAAEKAIESAGIDKEELDYIIVAHNFGDVAADNIYMDLVPTLAAKVKKKLKIKNPYAVAYDLPFGCPGWVQGAIQADYFIKSGDAKKALVIGSEILSKVVDPHDVDSMLYGDGAGAVIMEAKESDTPVGILTHLARTDALNHAGMLFMDKSYNQSLIHNGKPFVKMHGRKLYQYALETVPLTVKKCLEKSNTDLSEVSKVLIHQANGKMDDAILERLFQLYGKKEIPEHTMPMTISWLGNSSVATVPTLLDLIMKGELEPHEINTGDKIVFASVGAGMSINTFVYKWQ